MHFFLVGVISLLAVRWILKSKPYVTPTTPTAPTNNKLSIELAAARSELAITKLEHQKALAQINLTLLDIKQLDMQQQEAFNTKLSELSAGASLDLRMLEEAIKRETRYKHVINKLLVEQGMSRAEIDTIIQTIEEE